MLKKKMYKILCYSLANVTTIIPVNQREHITAGLHVVYKYIRSRRISHIVRNVVFARSDRLCVGF